MTTDEQTLADKIGRKRARIYPVIGLLFFIQQTAFFAQDRTDRMIDYGWLLLGLVIVAALATGGAWIRPKRIRALLNDEISRGNRKDAMSLGFILSMLTALAIYPLRHVFEFDVRSVVYLVLSVGLLSAMVRLGYLERQSYRGG